MTRGSDQDHAAGMRVVPAIVASVRQHRLAVAATILIVLAATIAAYMLIPRRYTAHADLWLDHGFDELEGTAAGVAGSSASPRARNTEIRLLTSSDLAAEVVDALGLANVRGIGQPKAGALVPRDVAHRTAAATVRKNLGVRANGASYAVAVSYAAPDPVLATAILNQLADSYVADRRSGGARGRERDRMRDQLAAARDDMIRGEATASGFRAATGLIRRQLDGDVIRAEIAALDTQLAAAQAERSRALAWLRRIRASGDPSAQAVSSQRIADLRSQQAQIAADRRTPAGAGPDAFDPRLGIINRELNQETQRVQILFIRARAARDRAGLLRAARNRANEELRASNETAGQIARFSGKADAARTQYALLAQRYDQLVAAQRRQRGTAYVVARAVVPGVRSFPDPARFALGGLIAALLAAGIVMLVLEALVKGFRTRRHLERMLGLPVIGMVPDLARVADADIPADDAMGPPDYLYNHPRSAFASAFRSIHTGLRLGEGVHSPRSIAVCSALQGEGKTTVSICLARSAAMAGLRVVLVDCDARRPAASRALSPYVEIGLAEVLEDRVPFRQALQRDTPSGAWFLAQGTDRATANGSTSSAAMAALIDALVREFDLVLLDTPPTLALAEAREVAAMADGVLLIARSRKTPSDATRIASDLLNQAGAKVAAATLTLVAP